MLLKWLFTLLAIVWLYQALRPMLFPPRPRQAPPPPPPPTFHAQHHNVPKARPDDDGEYIDYEEIK
ncbi:MAG: hypothetical protein KIS77_11960 [Saprospiraceae bacterium]|nr:hypothetical protein [Saprospiraceae bacterium]